MNKRMEKKKQKMEIVQPQAVQNTPVAQTAKATFYIQYQDQEYLASEIEEKIREKCLSAGISACDLKDLSIYVKPEDQRAYYTCGTENGFIEL